jgi:hypothetical protein
VFLRFLIVSVAINKFELISSTLGKVLITNVSKKDVKFYIEQIKILLQNHIINEFVENDAFLNAVDKIQSYLNN